MTIVGVTGARSEYDLLVDVYKGLNNCNNVDFSVIITGPHLSEKYGLTAKHVIDDGFTIADKIYSLIDSDTKQARALSIGYQIPGLVQTFLRIKPDLVLIAGDREEVLSVAMVCGYLDIKVAHFFGGDNANDGNIDNSVRFAVSKLAHIHFPTLKEHKRTLIKLGEDEWRIFQLGNPAIDRLINTPFLSPRELFDRLGVNFIELNEKFCILIQHSIITEVEHQASHIKESLEGILQTGVKCFLNYPNSDAGNKPIIDAYNSYVKKYPKNFISFKNLDRINFVNLLRNASCLIGNSSSGILEAPTLGLPVVNVGSRQKGRIHADNVIFVGNDRNEIYHAIEKSIKDLSYQRKIQRIKNPYGDGNSSKKIVDVILNLDLTKPWLHKNITY